ncbi:MAG: tryptophan 2,3-dioxygenase family protein [Planctomycetota bacterium]|jgi:tryptophan 2,3-dioxygenase|nr:tryptophan 2,3-dioxygenase [Blastopirellula sp.]
MTEPTQRNPEQVQRTPKQVQYGEYLRLDQLLSLQVPESGLIGPPAHDEMLFIIVHQAYELWFKQIVHELRSVIDVFDDPCVEDKKMGLVIHRLSRVRSIQTLLVQQIDVIETMTPLDFLEFRDLLVPASGFQSIQFKQIEIMLGLKQEQRIPADRDFYRTRLTPRQQEELNALEAQPSLLELTDRWLQRMPFLKFGDFDFWRHYGDAVERMLESDRVIVESNPALSSGNREVQLAALEATRKTLNSVLDPEAFELLRTAGEFRFSHRGFLSALFINLYRDEPMMYLPFRYLTLLLEIDSGFTTWRARHALMVQRMLGTKIGTGGSSGHDYLNRTTQRNRVYLDLFNVSTFLVPRSALPHLPSELSAALGFRFGN